jgi:hypothetical protein
LSRCVCEFCLYEGAEAKQVKRASAINCRRIENLSCELENANTSRDELANCWERLLLVKQEHIVDYRAGMIYLDGFDIALEMKDKERAKVFAKWAENVVGHCEGEDSDVLKVMREDLAGSCGEDDEDDAEDNSDQRNDGGSAEIEKDGEGTVGRCGKVDKGKGRATSGANDTEVGYRGYEDKLHWLFMIEAQQDDEEDESA